MLRRLLAAVGAALALSAPVLPAGASDGLSDHHSVNVDPVGTHPCWTNPGGSPYVHFRERYHETAGAALQVRLTVQRDDDAQWLQANGKWGPLQHDFFGFPAALPGGIGGGWSRVSDVPVFSVLGPGWRETTWRWDPPAYGLSTGRWYRVGATVVDRFGDQDQWVSALVYRGSIC